MLKPNKHCRGCVYCTKIGDMWGCDYIFKVGKSRPCPPAGECTVKKLRKKEKKCHTEK